MKKIHVWYVAFAVALILSGWYINGLIIDEMGYNIMDPGKHFSVWEFVWSLIFAAVAIYSFRQFKKLQPYTKKKSRSK